MTRLGPSKIWKNEASGGQEAAVGQMVMWIPFTCGSTIDTNAAIADVGENSDALLPGQGIRQSVMVHFKKLRANAFVKNLSEHDVHVQVYWCYARDRFFHNVHSGVKGTALGLLEDGFKERMLDADETTQGLIKSSNALVCWVHELNPYYSTPFMSKFKIYKTRRRTLKPADSMSVSCGKTPKYPIAAHQLVDDHEDALRKITCFPIVKFFGTLGHEKLANTTVSTMKCTMGYVVKKTISFTYDNPHYPLIALSNSKPTTGDFEGPAEFMEVDDDA